MRFNIFILLLFLSISSCNTADEASPSSNDVSAEYIEQLNESDAYKAIEVSLQALNDQEAIELEAIRALQSQQRSSTSEESFIFFVIGDSELNMRENTYPQLENWIQRINSIDDHGLEFPAGDFEDGESRQITKPQLVFLAGDINKDRAFGFSLPGDLNNITKQETNRLFNQLDDDILFLAGNGNHDWDPYIFGDGAYGNNLGGLFSNLGTAQFVRSRFYRALNSSDEISEASFNYDRNAGWFQPTTSAEFNYSLVYRGVRFTQLNQFLYEPAAMVSLESLFGAGPAWYFETDANDWFGELCMGSADEDVPHFVVQHFPIRTGNSWWNDDLGTSADELRKRFMDVFANSHEPRMFSGHNHVNATTQILPYEVKDHTCGYFADGYVTAVKASASRGAYAIAYVDLNNMSATNADVASFNFQILP